MGCVPIAALMSYKRKLILSDGDRNLSYCLTHIDMMAANNKQRRNYSLEYR